MKAYNSKLLNEENIYFIYKIFIENVTRNRCPTVAQTAYVVKVSLAVFRFIVTRSSLENHFSEVLAYVVYNPIGIAVDADNRLILKLKRSERLRNYSTRRIFKRED